MFFFICVEMNDYILKFGKRIDLISKVYLVLMSIWKVIIFLNDEYLKGIFVVSDDNYFYFWFYCYYSFWKNDVLYNLKVVLCILSGEVKYVICFCVVGKVGFCNYILVFLMKICKFLLYECKIVYEFENEEDM